MAGAGAGILFVEVQSKSVLAGFHPKLNRLSGFGGKSHGEEKPEQTAVPGRPEVPNAEVEKQLRNTPPLRFLLAEEKLPLGDLKVPMGFKVEG